MSKPGKRVPVYAEKLVTRQCQCDRKQPYQDDEKDTTCMKCGRPLSQRAVKALPFIARRDRLR